MSDFPKEHLHTYINRHPLTAAIYAAAIAVEECGASPALTNAVNKVHEARRLANVLLDQMDALKTVMIAAAEEIQEHWDAHCDAEGYGPANLMHRLEEGIASEYGYTAGAFAKLTAERDDLRAALAELCEAISDATYIEFPDHATSTAFNMAEAKARALTEQKT